MHKILMALALALPSLAMAVPNTLVHSGRLLDASGDAVTASKTVDLILYDGTNVERYREQHLVSFENGYFAVQVGSLTPLSASILSQDLVIAMEIDGSEVGREALSSVPYAMAVDGLVRVSAAPADCTAAGTLRWEVDHLEVCNGTDWANMDGRVSGLGEDFYLHMENDVTDALGNVAFTATSQAVFNSGISSQGTYSLSPNVYGAGAGSTVDWAARSDTTSDQWSLHPDITDDFTVEWDYRHTSDTGWEISIATNTHTWDTQYNTWCKNDGNTTPLPEGWSLMVNWQAYYVCFVTDTGAVTWPFSAKDTTWRHLKMTRTGTSLEFFVNGASQGTRTMPTITSQAPSYLYLSGSSNGTATGYSNMSYSLNEQVDELQWTWNP